MDIIVVESPAKAKTINRYLGDRYRVLASYGHVRDLPSKDGSVRPDEDFAMDWEIDAKAQKRLSEIRGMGAADLPLNLSYIFCKHLYYRKVLQDQVRSVTERGRDVVTTLLWGIRMKARLRPQRGLVVTLSGMDGSGSPAGLSSLPPLPPLLPPLRPSARAARLRRGPRGSSAIACEAA